VKTDGNPARYISAVRGQVLAIDRDQGISSVKTMDELKDDELGQPRLILGLIEGFAGAALLLAAVGVYGVIAYSVAQRTRELGIRQAIGAQRGDILRHVLKQAVVLAIAGVAAGLSGAYGLTRVMKSLLFGVSPTDPTTFAAVGLLFIVVALAASYLPARRATKIDPMAALRVT
jgi:ABC-type antimicrobial peptide transport system permease subunit